MRSQMASSNCWSIAVVSGTCKVNWRSIIWFISIYIFCVLFTTKYLSCFIKEIILKIWLLLLLKITISRHRYRFMSRWRSTGSCLRIESSSTSCVDIHLYSKKWWMWLLKSWGIYWSVIQSSISVFCVLQSSAFVERDLVYICRGFYHTVRREIGICNRVSDTKMNALFSSHLCLRRPYIL
jgi:hypothetical protein